MKKTLWLSLSTCILLSGCEAIELINSVGRIIGPLTEDKSNAEVSETSSASTPSTLVSGSPQPIASTPNNTGLDVVLSSDPSPVSTDWNIARGKDVTMVVSSTLSQSYAKERLMDGKLETSWFTAASDNPSMGKLPTIDFSFAKPVGILSINLRGDRERSKGMKIQELSVLLTSTQGVVMNETVQLPEHVNDVNLVLKKPADAVSSIRLTITRGLEAPGLAELEILGRP